jgi:hypothetical protein
VATPQVELDAEKIAGVMFAQRAALVMLMKTVETLASAQPGLFERIAEAALDDLRHSAEGPGMHAVREFEKILALIGPPTSVLRPARTIRKRRGAEILPFPASAQRSSAPSGLPPSA